MKLSDRALLLDQNIRSAVIAWLQDQPFDVLACREIGLGSAIDTVVLAWAGEHQRVLITHDTDFGELAVRTGRQHAGIALLRPSPRDVDVTIAQLRHALELDVPESGDWLLIVDIRDGRPRSRLRS